MYAVCGSDMHMKIQSRVSQELTKRVKDSSFEANATNEHDETPLHLLVKRPFTQDKLQLKMELIISMLTYSRADMNIPDNSGNSPLHSAVKVRLRAVNYSSANSNSLWVKTKMTFYNIP